MGSILYKDGTMVTSLKFEESDNKKILANVIKRIQIASKYFWTWKLCIYRKFFGNIKSLSFEYE
jgi:hypothetical protein